MKYVTGVTRCGNTEFRWGERTFIMGILNASPDSFSGDGIAQADEAVRYALALQEAGADIIDIGGESTRPGANPVSVEEEIRRVIPVITRVVRAVRVPLSVDTSKYEVARTALQAGAALVNDQQGLRADSHLAGLCAEHGVPVVLMANLRPPPGDSAIPRGDVMELVVASLRESLRIARNAGIKDGNIVLDPGLGFLRGGADDLEVLRRLGELAALGKPLLIGPSRKSFIGRVLDLPVEKRREGTAAAMAVGIAHGADIVRVHDVPEMARVARMSDAIMRRGQP